MTKKQENTKSLKKNETQKKSTKEQENLGDALAQALFGETQKKPKKRPYFYLEDFGLIIPYWGIVSVEKTCEWGRIDGKTQMVYGLVINQGIESSPNMPFGERKTIYANQGVRDGKFDAIMAAMEEHNAKMEKNNESLNVQIGALEKAVEDVLKAMNGEYVDEEDFLVDSTVAIEQTSSKLTTQTVIIKSLAADIYLEYAKLGKLLEQGEELLTIVRDAYNVIDQADLGDTVKQKMLAEVSMYFEEATALFGDIDAKTGAAYTLYAKNAAMVDSSDTSDTTQAVAVLAVTALDLIKAEGAYEQYADALAAIVAESLFTVADVEEAGKLNDEILDGDDGEDGTQNVHDRYYVDNNQIVIVTYGDRDDTTHEKTAYKSFILNYNNFAVVVDYEGVKYTIPSGGYVVLYAD